MVTFSIFSRQADLLKTVNSPVVPNVGELVGVTKANGDHYSGRVTERTFFFGNATGTEINVHLD